MSGGRTELHNGRFHNLYPPPNIIRKMKSWKMRWAGYVAGKRERRNIYKILAVKTEWKRPHGTAGGRCHDTITVRLKEIM
jgi:hypothetical protein